MRALIVKDLSPLVSEFKAGTKQVSRSEMYFGARMIEALKRE